MKGKYTLVLYIPQNTKIHRDLTHSVSHIRLKLLLNQPSIVMHMPKKSENLETKAHEEVQN